MLTAASRRCLPHISPHLDIKACQRCQGRGVLIEGAVITRCPECRGEGEVYQDEDKTLCTGFCEECVFAADCYPAHGQEQEQRGRRR